MTDEEANGICDRIRQIAYDIHVYLGTGYLEKIYETALAHRLEKAGFSVERQVPIKVFDEDGYELGDYFADIVANGVVLELKAVSALSGAHIAQAINYLAAMRIGHAMLINFGSAKFETRKLKRPITSSPGSPVLCGQGPHEPTATKDSRDRSGMGSPPDSPVPCGQ